MGQHAQKQQHHHVIRIGGVSGPRFTFDQVFPPTATQSAVYQHVVAPLLDATLEGYNATILAYGQTGSGKTHTILGPHDSILHNREQAGVLPRAVHDLFERLQERDTVTVKLQFLELYGEQIRDLLANSATASSESQALGGKLTIRDNGTDEPEVVGATLRLVTTADEALRCITTGMLRRVTGATAMNATSSRSHAMLSLVVEQTETIATPTAAQSTENVGTLPQTTCRIKRSKFNFVDLAGSERQKRTQSQGQRLKEGIDINKGLLVLGNVISALGDPKKRGKTFVPYRDSKLTRLLQGSLGGNHQTLMIACVSPASSNLEESLNCLRYANRAKNIQNNAVVNVDPTTRLVTELQAQVTFLAKDLWNVHQGKPLSECFVTKDRLEAIMGNWGGDPNGGTNGAIRQTTILGATGRSLSSSGVNGEKQVEQMEQALAQTRHELRESQKYHDAAEEQLYVAKAEKQLFELQLSILGASSSTGDTTSSNQQNKSIEEAFLKKAEDYEREIGRLRVSLQEAKAQATQATLWDVDEDVAIAQARVALERDRVRLASLQSRVSAETSFEDPGNALEADDGALDGEEQAEFEELDELTEKFLARAGLYDDAEGEDEGDNRKLNEEKVTPNHVDELQERHLQADLIELSKSIAAKEDLIDQLRLSQEKYANMRGFYEEKLQQMEAALDSKESEREHLILELERTKEDGPSKTFLGERLREKEEHIASLKRRQKELMSLTKVSSRNDSEINRLQMDVQAMKRKKVDLQKLLGTERKNHANELKRLHRFTMQKDRELNKQMKISSKREADAQIANQVAKSRLEELSHLRTKYRDTEKKLRLLSVKRGVMAKAGLDPVIVGRRETQPAATQKMTAVKGQRPISRTSSFIDPDSLRDFFDQKVADVVRKEALVDKLAQEWEDHFELTTQRDAALGGNGDEAEESLQGLNIQIQFKQDRIRQLAQRLGKQRTYPRGKASRDEHSDSFLFDQEFEKLCSEVSPQVATSTASRVLFGMIVRERRRIAALARTASALDERVQAAENSAETSEAALRSYMDEQRHELVSSTQKQQEQILSLMDMVKQGSDSDESAHALRDSIADSSSDPKLLILSNERIQVLERQVFALQNETEAVASYRDQIDMLTSNLVSASQESEDLQEELSNLRSALRQIREAATKGQQEQLDSRKKVLDSEVLDIVKGALHPRVHSSGIPKRRFIRPNHKRSTDRPFLSPRLKKHVELMHTSDSEDNFDDKNVQDWTSEIMADLALIAEGQMPPSLMESPELVEEASKLANFSVFDRLADPDRFTGIQKHSTMKTPAKATGSKSKRPKSPGGHVQRRALSRQIADRLDKIIIPGDEPRRDSSSQSLASPSPLNIGSLSDQKDYKSVFDRLISPSQYTGTQKEKFQETKDKRARAAEEVADRMLDDLLESDNDPLEKQMEQTAGAAPRLSLEYTQQDVFERLQKTTTQSYAVKHNGTMLPDYDVRGDFAFSSATVQEPALPDKDLSSSSVQSEPLKQESNTHSDYTSQDVFERLQKTTTEAYAKKTNRAKRDGW
jgi:kinesin family protein 4/21/27